MNWLLTLGRARPATHAGRDSTSTRRGVVVRLARPRPRPDGQAGAIQELAKLVLREPGAREVTLIYDWTASSI